MLIKNAIKAPKLLKHNYHENYIEIEDFGKFTIYSILKNKKKNKFKIFKKIILVDEKGETLNKLVGISTNPSVIAVSFSNSSLS